MEKRDFDQLAANWDTPQRLRLAEDLLAAISGEVALGPDLDVLDFGCGTGLLATALAPRVRSVVGVDASRGMLEVLQGKIAASGLRHVRALHREIDAQAPLPGPVHLAVSAMTLHHVPDPGPLLEAFHAVLHPGGHLALADLDAEDGTFHGDNTGVFHFGFERGALRDLFRAAGFQEVRHRTASEIVKPGRDGGTRRYPVFLMVGRK
ncbi:MAG: class I SAM-dependent methyltransferase [Acidobacteria bacterium]|nr:class I SAM-dependent methyltransferase [Acidobacteriota bacterium]